MLISAWAATALAAEPQLDWSAPTPCPGLAEITAETELLVGASLDAVWPAGLRVAGIVTSDGGAYRLQLTVEDESGRSSRLLGPESSCDTLAHAAALIAAIAIDPSVGTAGEGPMVGVAPGAASASDAAPLAPTAHEGGLGDRAATDEGSSPEPVTQARGEVPPAEPLAQARAAPPGSRPGGRRGASARRAWRRTARSGLLIRLGAAGDIGSLPAATGGLVAAGGWAGPELRAEMGLGLWPSRRQTVSSAEAAADISLTAGTARGCVRVSRRRPEPWVCAGFDLGWMQGTGHGISAPEAGGALSLAATSGVALSVSLARQLSVWLEVGPVLQVIRPRFFFEDLGDVHQPSRVAGRAQVALEWRPR